MNSHLGNRQYERATHPVRLSINKHILGSTLNISIGGAFAIVNKEVPEMDELDIILELPDGDFEVKGTCLRSSSMGEASYHIALLFQIETENEDNILRLARFINCQEMRCREMR
jgi:hypothetical protein